MTHPRAQLDWAVRWESVECKWTENQAQEEVLVLWGVCHVGGEAKDSIYVTISTLQLWFHFCDSYEPGSRGAMTLLLSFGLFSTF